MPAHRLVSASSSVTGGKLGPLDPVGRVKEGISPGLKLSGWNSLSDTLSGKLSQALVSRFMETIESSSRGGGQGEVGTTRLTKFSSASTFSSDPTSAQSTPDTCRVRPIQQTDLREAFFQNLANVSHTSKSPQNLPPSSSLTTMPNREFTGSLAMMEAFESLVSPGPTNLTRTNVTVESPLASIPKLGKNSKRKAPGRTLKIQNEAPYPPSKKARASPKSHLANPLLVPSPLRPNCCAKDRIRVWRPEASRATLDSQGGPSPLSLEDFERIEGVALNSLQPSTQATYGAGLYAFHLFCDSKEVAENLRAPIALTILQLFVARMAGIYSASAISGYVAAIRAWHIIHGTPWSVGGPELNAIIKGAQQMAPRSSTRQKREPITISYIEKIHSSLSETNPLDVAVFACLTSAFWATARLGELTVKNLDAFNPTIHVKRSNLEECTDRKGLKTTSIHVPETKSNRTEGERLYWARQDGPSDPERALKRHLEINNPAADFHLFGYPGKDGKMIPLTKTNFLKRLSSAAQAVGLPKMHGHSIRIGSTLEYLLRGVPFDVMKTKGRWNSDAFQKYLRDHARVLAPYMQAAPPDIHDQFIRITIPSAR
jgi:hypothetical protein